MIRITDQAKYHPVSVQYLILGVLKGLYPIQVEEKLAKINAIKRNLFCKANSTDEIYRLLDQERYGAWKMISYQSRERKAFRKARTKYLIPEYSPSKS